MLIWAIWRYFRWDPQGCPPICATVSAGNPLASPPASVPPPTHPPPPRRARLAGRPPPRSHPEVDPPRRRLPTRSGGRSAEEFLRAVLFLRRHAELLLLAALVQGDGFDAWRWLRRVGLAAAVERTVGSRPQLASPGGGGVPGDRALRSRPPGRRRRPLLWPLHGLWPPS